MMQAMGLKSPAPIQSRLKHLQEKGYIPSPFLFPRNLSEVFAKF